MRTLGRRGFLWWGSGFALAAGGAATWLWTRKPKGEVTALAKADEGLNILPLKPGEASFDARTLSSSFLLPGEAEFLLSDDAELIKGAVRRIRESSNPSAFAYLSSSSKGDVFFSASGGYELVTALIHRTSGDSNATQEPLTAASKFLTDGRLACINGTAIRYLDAQGHEHDRKDLDLGLTAPALLALSADGRWLLVRKAASSTWMIYDIQSQCFRACVELPSASGPSNPQSRGRIDHYDPLSSTFGEDSYESRAWFSPAGDWVAILNADQVYLWHWPDSDQPSRKVNLSKWDVQDLAILDGHRAWAVCTRVKDHTQSDLAYGETRILDLNTQKALPPGIGRPRAAQIALNRQGSSLFVRYGDATVREYDLARGRMIRLVTAHMPKTSSLAFAASDRWVIASSWRSQIWDRQGKIQKIPGEISEDWLYKPPVAELALGSVLAWSTPMQRVLVASESYGVFLFDPTKLDRIPLLLNEQISSKYPNVQDRLRVGQIAVASDSPIRCLQASPVNALIAGMTQDGTVILWDGEKQTELRRWKAHESMGNTLVFSADGRQLLTGGWDGATLWDIATTQKQAHLDTEGHWVSSVSLHPKHGYAAVACLDGNIRIWNPDSTTGKPDRMIPAHEGWVGGIAFAPDGNRLASCGEDGYIRTWDPQTGVQKAERSKPASSICWSPDGRKLAGNGMDHVAILNADLSYQDSESTTLHLDWDVEFT